MARRNLGSTNGYERLHRRSNTEKRLSMRKERISINFAMLVTSVPECCNRERLNTSTIVMIKLKTERHSDSIWKVGWQLPFESTSQVRGCPSPRLLRFIQ